MKEFAQAKDHDAFLKKLSKTDKYSTQLVKNTQVLSKDCKIVIPKVLQIRAVSWYHHYLHHSGHTRLKEMLHTAIYWNDMRNIIRLHVKNCC